MISYQTGAAGYIESSTSVSGSNRNTWTGGIYRRSSRVDCKHEIWLVRLHLGVDQAKFR